MLAGDALRESACEESFGRIAEQGLPCAAAKPALARRTRKMPAENSLESGRDNLRIHADHCGGAAARRNGPGGPRSLVVASEGRRDLIGKRFESARRERLHSLVGKSCRRAQSDDRRANSGPADSHVSLSFGGQASVVAGQHPGASRPARRTLVLNLHYRFKRLREEGRYHRMHATIRPHAMGPAGKGTPMLAGETSETWHYRRRLVGQERPCLFQDKRGQ